ncbi:MAG TPA: class D sortase [Vicinamibacterales bacterium]|nr:class D sortase [Vicinamibacterales bacterium]
MSGIRETARLASWLLLGVGILLLAYAAYVVIDARVYEARALKRLAQERSAQVAVPEPVEGAGIGEIRIGRLDVSAVVVQGESEVILRRAVGHLARTALPGDEGNVVLAGHRDTFFRPLKDILQGDRITLQTSQRAFEYVVESTSIVKPTDVGVIEPSGGHTLTLITCFPFYYVGPAPNRFIVVARETE